MQNTTSNGCENKASLVAFLYGECAAMERQRVETHLAACAGCRDEVESLRAVRGTLGGWTAPEPELDFRVVPADVAAAGARVRPWTRGWAVAAAAVLVLAVGAGLANVEVRYGPDGVVVRTGWSEAVSTAAPAAGAVPGATDDAPWRPELAALESSLRDEFTGRRSAGVGDPELLGHVQGLIDESERRQQRDLALRFAQLMEEAEAQRQADLLRIEQQVGQLAGLTEAEVVQHDEIMDYLVRVAGRGGAGR